MILNKQNNSKFYFLGKCQQSILQLSFGICSGIALKKDKKKAAILLLVPTLLNEVILVDICFFELEMAI